jgi:glycosyltransferase involved in cell wall biosynthesis
MSEPFVTIILPIRNEEIFIRRTLESILSQDYPPDRFEILVVDGMSVDATREIVNEIVGHYPNASLKILDNPFGIVPTALNIGLAQSRGDIIIRVDGHCEIFPAYVRMCIQHLQNFEADCVGGSLETVGTTLLGKSIAIAMSSFFGVGSSIFRIVHDRQFYVDTVPFPAYTRQALTVAGRFDEEMLCNEDDEYNYRIRKLGMKILITSDIKSRYYCRNSLHALWKQYFRYGLWKVRLLQKYPQQMSLRQFVPPVFVLALLVTFVIGFWINSGWIMFFVVSACYLLAGLGYSLIQAFRLGWKNIFLLPVCYATLHFSYGIGFLMGLLKFVNRWSDKQSKVPLFVSKDA